MKAVAVFFLFVLIIALVCACGTSGGQNSTGNISREQAIQIVEKISSRTGEVEINSYPDMDKEAGDIRYYYIQVVYANRMSAAYFVDNKEGCVYIAVGGELDIGNPLPETDDDIDDQSGMTEIAESQTGIMKDVIDSIGLTEKEVEQKFGSDYKKVFVNYDKYMKAHIYSDLGLTVAFGNNDKVACVYCSDKVEFNGAKSGMNFSQIQAILGETSSRQSWAETPVNTVYEIQYRCQGRTVTFFSRQKAGNDSIMSIR